MGCSFLALRHMAGYLDLHERASVAARWLPLVPEQHGHWTAPDGVLRVDAWSVHNEAARGGFFARGRGAALAMTGWIQEEQRWPMTATVAANLLAYCGAQGFGPLLDERCGEYAVLHADEDGQLRAACDPMGGQHLYYGERNGLVAVSNRAFLVAAALDGAGLPQVDPLRLAWLMSGLRAMFAGETLFDGVHILAPGKRLEVDGRGIRVVQAQSKGAATSHDWDVHFAELCDRVAQIRRLPDVRFRQTLTGGKDSRLLLGALVASGAIEDLDDCWIEAEPGHPDAELAQHLATHYGLSLDVVKAERADHPLFDLVALHNFQAEAAFHAYDTKGSEQRPRQGVINGHYGEIYKSHVQLRFLGGWSAVRAFYGSRRFIDKWGLLAAPARDRCRRLLLERVQTWRDEGTPLLDVHDRWHRECRMHRWLGQAMQHDAIGDLSFNPLPSPHLLRHYRSLPIVERKLHRTHFELTRRVDDWLWRQPLANDRWSRHLLRGHGRPEPALRRRCFQILPQFRQWQAAEAQIAHFLLDGTDDGFFDIIDRKHLEQRLALARAKPTLRPVEQMLGLVGMRAALQGIHARPMRMAAPAAASQQGQPGPKPALVVYGEQHVVTA